MTDKNDQAFPTEPRNNGLRGEEYQFFPGQHGLSKREWYAGLAMAGRLANPSPIQRGETIYSLAIYDADQQIAELNKPKEPEKP